MRGGAAAVVLATPAEIASAKLHTRAAIARALRSERAKVGWVNRRIRAAERLAGVLIEWRTLREQFPELVDPFMRTLRDR